MKLSQKKQREYKKQLMAIFAEQGYTVVSGKGTFQQGSCLVLNEKKVVVNSYLPTDLQLKFLYDTAVELQFAALIPEEIVKFSQKVS
jgi:hypothetical protein